MPQTENYFSKDCAGYGPLHGSFKHGKVKTRRTTPAISIQPDNKARRNEIDEYMNGRLNLPAVNVFARAICARYAGYLFATSATSFNPNTRSLPL